MTDWDSNFRHLVHRLLSGLGSITRYRIRYNIHCVIVAKEVIGQVDSLVANSPRNMLELDTLKQTHNRTIAEDRNISSYYILPIREHPNVRLVPLI
jgi:hypothetical protein